MNAPNDFYPTLRRAIDLTRGCARRPALGPWLMRRA